MAVRCDIACESFNWRLNSAGFELCISVCLVDIIDRVLFVRSLAADSTVMEYPRGAEKRRSRIGKKERNENIKEELARDDY